VTPAYVTSLRGVGGAWFFLVMDLTLLAANFWLGTGLAVGAARLLFWEGSKQCIAEAFFEIA